MLPVGSTIWIAGDVLVTELAFNVPENVEAALLPVL